MKTLVLTMGYVFIFWCLTGISSGFSVSVELFPEQGSAQVRQADNTLIADTSKLPDRGNPSLVYDEKDRLTRIIAPDVEYYLEYDQEGRVSLVVENGTSHRDIAYKKMDSGFQATVWDSERGETVYLYTPFELRITETPRGGGKTTQTVIDRITGERLTIAPDGSRVRLSPSGEGWRMVVSHPQRELQMITLSKEGRILESVGEAGHFRLMKSGEADRLAPSERETLDFIEQDGSGRPVKVISGGDVVAEYEYNAANQLTRMTLPGGTVWKLSYDVHGRPASCTSPGDGRTRFQYGGNGSEMSIDRPTGGSIKTVYDDDGRMVQQAGPGASELLIEYADEEGAVTVTQPGFDVQRETWIEDEQNMLCTYESELFGSWFFRYAPYANTVTRIAPGGEMAFFTYDRNHQLSSIKSGRSTKRAQFLRNADGNIVQSVTPDSTVDFTYDQAGRLIREADPESGVSLAYTYTPKGLLASIKDSTGLSIHYRYDAQERVTDISSSVFGEFQIEYGSYGLPERIRRPNGRDTLLTHDNNALLSGFGMYKKGHDKSRGGKTFTCNAEGYISAINSSSRKMKFDWDQQLHRAGRTINGKKIAQSYDAWGNRIQDGANTISYSRPGLPSSWNDDVVTCDEAGRITQIGANHLTYNWDNRLATASDSSGSKTSWTVDALGRLHRVQNKDTDVRFFFAGGRPFARLDEKTKQLMHYLFVPGFSLCFAWTDEDGNQLYPIWDGAAQVLFTTDQTGKSHITDRAADMSGQIGFGDGLLFLRGQLLYRDGRFYSPGLNRALAPPAPWPYESVLHMDNPISFGEEHPLRATHRQGGR